MAQFGPRKRAMGDFAGPGAWAKMPRPDGGEFGGPGAWSKMPRSDEPLLKMLIPYHMCGHVLGKGGCNIKELGKNHKGRISFSDANTFFPGTEDRICLIQAGMGQRVNDIGYQLMEKMMRYENTTTRLLVTPRGAGLIIGKGGSTIKELEGKTGAKVATDKVQGTEMPERVVTMKGTLKQRGEALKRITELIAEEPSNMANINLMYEGGGNMGMEMPMHGGGFGPQEFGPSMDAQQLKEQLYSAITGYPPMSQNPGDGTVLASTVELKFDVPFHMVGYILGSKGACIKEMTRLSKGAKFEFEDFAGPEVINGGLRKLTVTGSLEQINLAYELVHAKAYEYMGYQGGY